MTEDRPAFMDWVDTTGPAWRLKPGAPADVVEAFAEYQEIEKQHWDGLVRPKSARQLFDTIKED